MEIAVGTVHRAFPMDDASRVGEARRYAAQLAADMAWDPVQAGKLAVVVTELGTNLVRHAQRGELLIAMDPALQQVEILSSDHGPGIANLQQSMADGYSTGGTPGTGLGAVRRMSQEFDIHSAPTGTLVMARLNQAAAPRKRLSPIRIGAVCVAAPGETVSGDSWAACLESDRAAVIVADGLGHGPDAAEASLAAIAAFQHDPFGSLAQTLASVHRDLRGTRGAAASLLIADSAQATLRGAGAGNVVTRVVSGTFDKTLLSQHGTLGLEVRRAEEVTAPWPDHAMLILHSDGIATRWASDSLYPLMQHDPVLVALLLLRDQCRGRDDATIVVLQREAH